MIRRNDPTRDWPRFAKRSTLGEDCNNKTSRSEVELIDSILRVKYVIRVKTISTYETGIENERETHKLSSLNPVLKGKVR